MDRLNRWRLVAVCATLILSAVAATPASATPASATPASATPALATPALATPALATPALAQDNTGAAQDQDLPAEPEPISGSISLVGQSASVQSDGEFSIVVDWDGEFSSELFLSVLFHQRINNERDVIGASSNTILNRHGPIPIDEVGTDPDGNLVVSIPVRSISPAADDRVYLPGPGVYPFTVEVRSSEGLLSSASSNVVRLPQDISQLATLDFAIVLSLSPADGLDLSDGLLFLTSYPTMPFTIQLDEGVLTTLESEPALAEQFALAAAGRPVLSDAGIDLDPSALAEIEQGRFYLQARAATAARISRLGLTPSTEIAMLSTQLTAAGADLLSAAGVAAVFSTRTIEIDTGTITTARSSLKVIQPNRSLTEELGSNPGTGFVPREIYELYARLSLRADEDQTSIILGGQGAPVLDPQSLDAFLRTLGEDGALRPVSLLDALQTQPRNPLLAAERPEQNLFESGEAIAELQQLAETSRSFRGVQNADLERLLIDSLSRTRNPSDRARAIDRAKAELLADLSSITLPATQSLTLAAVDGPLPLTIRNDADGSRLVRLEFRGDRVAIEEDGLVVTVPPGETTLELSAKARALGVSTLEVTALTPDGQRVLSTSRYEIRSTAVPGLGWAISGTALAFLLLWWLRNARKSHPRRPHLVGVADAARADAASANRNIAADAAEAL